MTTNGVIADVFVTPHLMHVDLTDPDTAATFCGCQVIGRKQMNVKVSLLSRHLCRQRPRQHLHSRSGSVSFNKASYLQNSFDPVGVQMPAHRSESSPSLCEGSGNPCDDCVPACKNSDFGRLPHTQIGPGRLLIKGTETTHNVDMISLARSSVQDLVNGS